MRPRTRRCQTRFRRSSRRERESAPDAQPIHAKSTRQRSLAHLRNFVNGEFTSTPPTAATSDIIDPATGEVYATAPLSGAAGRRPRATQAAATAFEAWRDTTPGERQPALLKFADAIEARAEELVALEIAEHRQADRR